jgi:hypothetical protein
VYGLAHRGLHVLCEKDDAITMRHEDVPTAGYEIRSIQ